MNTTNYILELFIAGVSTIIWVILLLFAFWGDPILTYYKLLGETDKLLLAFVAAPIIYVFGVIVDRLVDSFFDIYNNKSLREKYFLSEEEYRTARSKIYLQSDSLTNLFEYGRVRIRICRNWIFNGSLILISGAIFIINLNGIPSLIKIKVAGFFVIFMIGSIASAFVAWRDLNIKEFNFLKIQSEILDYEEKVYQ